MLWTQRQIYADKLLFHKHISLQRCQLLHIGKVKCRMQFSSHLRQDFFKHQPRLCKLI